MDTDTLDACAEGAKLGAEASANLHLGLKGTITMAFLGCAAGIMLEETGLSPELDLDVEYDSDSDGCYSPTPTETHQNIKR